MEKELITKALAGSKSDLEELLSYIKTIYITLLLKWFFLHMMQKILHKKLCLK